MCLARTMGPPMFKYSGVRKQPVKVAKSVPRSERVDAGGGSAVEGLGKQVPNGAGVWSGYPCFPHVIMKRVGFGLDPRTVRLNSGLLAPGDESGILMTRNPTDGARARDYT